MKLKDIAETFEADLQDPDFVQVYLQEAMNDGMTTLLLALRNVIQANEGKVDIANEVGVGQESLYQTLSETGNPHFVTIEKIVKALGLRLAVVSDAAAKV